MADRTYYVLCADNCKFEGMTKEQIITAINNAISTGSVGDVDAGFITKVKATNADKYITFWLGTRAEYNALTTKSENCLYIITDDDSYEQLIAAFENNKGISQTEGDERYLQLRGGTMTGALNMNSKKITNVAAPTNSGDAVNKLYVDGESVTGTGAITVTIENNKDYAYTDVTSLAMTAAAVKCHGFIGFGSSTPTINVSGFAASNGDDITAAAAGEVWEFSVFPHSGGAYIIWKNWSA